MTAYNAGGDMKRREFLQRVACVALVPVVAAAARPSREAVEGRVVRRGFVGPQPGDVVELRYRLTETEQFWEESINGGPFRITNTVAHGWQISPHPWSKYRDPSGFRPFRATTNTLGGVVL